MRLPQPASSPYLYPSATEWASYSHGFRFHRLWRLAGLEREYLICRHTGMNSVRSRSYFTIDGQSVSMSWCRAHSGTCNLILLPVGRLLSESCGLVSVGSLSDEKTGLQFAVRSLNGPRRAEPVTTLYCLMRPPPTRRARFPYLYPPRTGWPSYTPGLWVPFTSPLKTGSATIGVL
jgi:hypothetical protein